MVEGRWQPAGMTEAEVNKLAARVMRQQLSSRDVDTPRTASIEAKLAQLRRERLPLHVWARGDVLRRGRHERARAASLMPQASVGQIEVVGALSQLARQLQVSWLGVLREASHLQKKNLNLVKVQ